MFFNIYNIIKKIFLILLIIFFFFYLEICLDFLIICFTILSFFVSTKYLISLSYYIIFTSFFLYKKKIGLKKVIIVIITLQIASIFFLILSEGEITLNTFINQFITYEIIQKLLPVTYCDDNNNNKLYLKIAVGVTCVTVFSFYCYYNYKNQQYNDLKLKYNDLTLFQKDRLPLKKDLKKSVIIDDFLNYNFNKLKGKHQVYFDRPKYNQYDYQTFSAGYAYTLLTQLQSNLKRIRANCNYTDSPLFHSYVHTVILSFGIQLPSYNPKLVWYYLERFINFINLNYDVFCLGEFNSDVQILQYKGTVSKPNKTMSNEDFQAMMEIFKNFKDL